MKTSKISKKSQKNLSDHGVKYTPYIRTTEDFAELKMLRKWGITLEHYRNILKEQNEVCAICGGKDREKKLAIDHCHDSGLIRGLLCSRCNLGLGHFRDSVQVLKNALEYLEKHHSKEDRFFKPVK